MEQVTVGESAYAECALMGVSFVRPSEDHLYARVNNVALAMWAVSSKQLFVCRWPDDRSINNRERQVLARAFKYIVQQQREYGRNLCR